MQRPYVNALVHENGGVLRCAREEIRDSLFHRNAGTGVDASLAQGDRDFSPGRGVTAGNADHEQGPDNGLTFGIGAQLRQRVCKEDREDGEDRKQLQSVAHVVVGERPPYGYEDGHAAVGDRQGVKDKW